jgi:hypothetical protein
VKLSIDLFQTGKYAITNEIYGWAQCLIIPASEKASNPNLRYTPSWPVIGRVPFFARAGVRHGRTRNGRCGLTPLRNSRRGPGCSGTREFARQAPDVSHVLE